MGQHEETGLLLKVLGAFEGFCPGEECDQVCQLPRGARPGAPLWGASLVLPPTRSPARLSGSFPEWPAQRPPARQGLGGLGAQSLGGPAASQGKAWAGADAGVASAGAGPGQAAEQAGEGGGRWPLTFRHRLHRRLHDPHGQDEPRPQGTRSPGLPTSAGPHAGQPWSPSQSPGGDSLAFSLGPYPLPTSESQGDPPVPGPQ